MVLPDERWGDVGVLFVETAPRATLGTDVIRVHLEARLARFKLPKHIHLVTDLPRNATGKIRGVDLRARARLVAATTPTEEPR